jgi:hypothetical protein
MHLGLRRLGDCPKTLLIQLVCEAYAVVALLLATVYLQEKVSSRFVQR